MSARTSRQSTGTASPHSPYCILSLTDSRLDHGRKRPHCVLRYRSIREVDEIAYEYLCSFRRSNIAPPYTGMTTKG
jgi:hypothetical protein